MNEQVQQSISGFANLSCRLMQMFVVRRENLLSAAMLASLILGVGVLLFTFTGDADAFRSTGTRFFLLLIAVLSVSIFTGNSGVLSFAQVVFMGFGAYASALLSIPTSLKATLLPNLPDWIATLEFSFGTSVLGAILLVALLALLIGVPIVRMSGAASVIATLGLLLMSHSILTGARDFTRGSQVIYGLPAAISLMWVVIICAFVIFAARTFKDTRVGLQLRASRENELAAQTIGVNVTHVRLTAWVLAGSVGALAGALYGNFLGVFSPKEFYMDITFLLIVMMVVGGFSSTTGAMVGTFVVMTVIEVLRHVEEGFQIGPFTVPQVFGLTDFGLGLSILAVLYWRKQGIVGFWELALPSFNKRSDEDASEIDFSALFKSDRDEQSGKKLVVTDLGKRFGGLQAVDNVSFELNAGEIVGLIGPNGSGKTTTVNMLSGALTPTSGKVVINDVDVTKLPMHERASYGIGRTFQNIALFMNLSVVDNVRAAYWTANPDTGSSDVEVHTILKSLGLLVHANQPAGQLAYGIQRRLEIARALALHPTYLLLDEPAAGLNHEETEELLSFLVKLKLELSIGIMIIDHDLKLIMRLCDRIVVLNKGQKIAEGSPEEIRKNPEVIESYIGTKRGESSPKTQKLEIEQ